MGDIGSLQKSSDALLKKNVIISDLNNMSIKANLLLQEVCIKVNLLAFGVKNGGL